MSQLARLSKAWPSATEIDDRSRKSRFILFKPFPHRTQLIARASCENSARRERAEAIATRGSGNQPNLFLKCISHPHPRPLPRLNVGEGQKRPLPQLNVGEGTERSLAP